MLFNIFSCTSSRLFRNISSLFVNLIKLLFFSPVNGPSNKNQKAYGESTGFICFSIQKMKRWFFMIQPKSHILVRHFQVDGKHKPFFKGDRSIHKSIFIFGLIKAICIYSASKVPLTIAILSSTEDIFTQFWSK